MRLEREMKVRPDLQLALTRQDIDHGASISRSPAAVVATEEGDLTPLEDANRLAISQRVGLRGIYLSLTDGRRPCGGSQRPAFLLDRERKLPTVARIINLGAAVKDSRKEAQRRRLCASPPPHHLPTTGGGRGVFDAWQRTTR